MLYDDNDTLRFPRLLRPPLCLAKPLICLFRWGHRRVMTVRGTRGHYHWTLIRPFFLQSIRCSGECCVTPVPAEKMLRNGSGIVCRTARGMVLGEIDGDARRRS